MSQSPIEFLGEEPAHELPSTEFGGADGLIQPLVPPVRGLNALEGHGDEAFLGTREGVGELNSMIMRRGSTPLDPTEAWTGVASAASMGPGGEVMDPETGRLVPVDGNKPGGAGAGELSDLQPGR